MSDAATPDKAAPWGPREPDAAAPAPPLPPSPPNGAAPTPASRLQTWIWGAVSTLLLAGWIAWQMGWLWALAAVVGVFVHEFGHMLVINWAGSGPSGLRIIPFFGGAATMARPPQSDFKGVLIALAGPVFGLLAALPFFALAAWTDQPGWRQGAFVVGAINLLNLAPAPPLDGSKALGPVLARIHPMLERVALSLVGAFAVVWMLSRSSLAAPISLLAPLVIGMMTLASLRATRLRAPAEPLSTMQWSLGLALYLAALALCATVASLGAVGVLGFNFAFGDFGAHR